MNKKKSDPSIVKTFSFPLSKLKAFEKFMEIAEREGKSVSETIMNVLEDYAKVHEKGNPQHLLSSFQNNEDFIGFPSMATSLKDKKKYMKNVLKLNPKLKQQMEDHLNQWSGIIKHE